MRRPVKICGIAAGNCSLTSLVQRLALCSVNRSCWPASAEMSPKKVLARIGNTEMITHTSTRERKLKSKNAPISGTNARIGMACRATAKGQIMRSIHLARLINVAVATPTTMAMNNPTAATWVLSHSASNSALRITPLSMKLRLMTRCGGGTRNRRPSDMPQ
jgi:hypothetical protein